ncbi:MAG: Tat pathway signal protein [Hydrogenophilales bacterium 28-61-23]|nr:MAG: Tat pathway signal protein [Hydrogenophilales bacterium 28-61-23]
MITRRQFIATAPGLLGSALAISGCSRESESDSYEALASRTWRLGALSGESGISGVSGTALGRELVRYATLAPSSHNTQCWKFALDGDGHAITILPDLSRRCPAVDPDDHHMFVSLGCAAENLVQAALAHGLKAEVSFDAARNAVHVALAPVPAQTTPLFKAIAVRQCTRGDYDAKPLPRAELTLLERAGSSNGVRMLVITERTAMERVLEQVVQANTAQMADPAFVKELKSWIRFNGTDAVRTGDGLFSATTGNPTIPTWLGELAFGWFFTPKGENDKVARQIRSSGGIAVFVGQAVGRAHWVEVGRCYERFALQATALGIRNALFNQPVEVAAMRPHFASLLGLGGQRPDLVVRFGRGPAMPRSLRRPVAAVLV